MGGQYGVSEIKPVAVALFELGEVIHKIRIDKDSSKLGRFGKVLTLADDLLAVMGVDVSEFRKQIGELDADDKAKIYAAVAKEFDVPDEDLERKVEESMKHGLDMIDSGYKLAMVHAS